MRDCWGPAAREVQLLLRVSVRHAEQQKWLRLLEFDVPVKETIGQKLLPVSIRISQGQQAIGWRSGH